MSFYFMFRGVAAQDGDGERYALLSRLTRQISPTDDAFQKAWQSLPKAAAIYECIETSGRIIPNLSKAYERHWKTKAAT